MPYTTTPFGQWTEDEWIEFFGYLATKLNYSPGQKRLEGIERTKNKGGKMVEVYWYSRLWRDNPEYRVYIRIDAVNREVHFRVLNRDEKTHPTHDVINECTKIITAEAAAMGRREIVRPDNIGDGKMVTFARVKTEDWLIIDNGLVNLEKTVELLLTYERVWGKCFE